MADVRPFRPLRPRDDLAGEVITPPYDVLTEAEARALARNPNSFIHVTRPEVDLPEGAPYDSEEAYARARENLDALRARGVLVEDAEPTYILYGQTMGSHHQVGVIAACSVAEYDAGRIARHELTRPDKEDDRVKHMEAVEAQTGLVFLAHAPSEALRAVVSRVAARPPAWEVRTEDGVWHRTWRPEPGEMEQIRAALPHIPKLYIADGHHRSAAASRVHQRRGDAASAWFMAGLFPWDQLQVLAYNRVTRDLGDLDEQQFFEALHERWHVEPGVGPDPEGEGDIRMFMRGRRERAPGGGERTAPPQWYRLTLREAYRSDDPVDRLDCAALQTHLFEPLLGIHDPRGTGRIEFVGGIHGPEELARRVEDPTRGDAVAFRLYPVRMERLVAVADAGRMMPPKSTWFEPKLRSGVAVRRFDGA